MIETKEMSLRKTVSSLTGDQGFISCYYERKCQTEKCACFKSNLKFNLLAVIQKLV